MPPAFAPQPSYYITDHLGNTRVVYHTDVTCSNTTYHIEYLGDYYPYGKILRSWQKGFLGEKYLTTRHERDHETGLDYHGARYYDSEMGRFLAVDPLAAEMPDWSTYSYTYCNPIGTTDPTGMYPEGWSDHNIDLANRFGVFGEGAGTETDVFQTSNGEDCCPGALTGVNFTLWLQQRWSGMMNSGASRIMSGTSGSGGIANNPLVPIDDDSRAVLNKLEVNAGIGEMIMPTLEVLEATSWLIPAEGAVGFGVSLSTRATWRLGKVSPFGLRGGYGLFGENGLRMAGYRIDALYANPRSGERAGTFFSAQQLKAEGALWRWDYGKLHSTGQMGVHSTIRFYLNGTKYGSTAQRTCYPSTLQPPFFNPLK